MPELVDIRNADDTRDVIHRAVHLLAEGKLVAFPTETAYVVTALSLQKDGIEKLKAAGDVKSTAPRPLLIKSAHEALDYVPNMPALGRKLARRCWPGPVTIGFDVSASEGLLKQLPAETLGLSVIDNEARFRVTAGATLTEVLRLLPAPLIMLPEKDAGQEPMTTAAEVADRFADHLAMIIDNGPSRFGNASTVIRITGENWQVVVAGIVNEPTLARLASEVYLFVCTGNTCRSPMAEGFFRKFLAERLQCSEEELSDRGYIVESAGLAANVGASATPESVDVVAKLGIDLRRHASQPLSERLLDHSDHIFTMTRVHRDSILAMRPDISDRLELLSRDHDDISDPIGGGIAEYEKCKDEIERHVRSLINDIVIE
jgi:protein-tyrosine phosphatase